MQLFDIYAKLAPKPFFGHVIAVIPNYRRYSVYIMFNKIFFRHFRIKRIMQELQKAPKSQVSRFRILLVAGDRTRDTLTFGILSEQLTDKYWVKVVYHLQAREWISCVFPNMLVLSEAYSFRTKSLIKLVKKVNPNAIIVVLDGEGTFSPATAEHWVNKNPDIDHLIVWGQYQKQTAVRFGVDEKKIVSIGNPRFDWHFRPIRKESFLKYTNMDPTKKIILYASNMVVRKGGKVFDFPASYPVQKYIQLRTLLFETLLNIAERHPEYQFVIKPHPVEINDIYEPLIKKRRINNFVVIGEDFENEKLHIYDVVPYIDVFVHWSSTSSIDAWVHNKPTISAQLLDMGNAIASFIEGGYIAKSEKELEELIIKAAKNPEIPEEIESIRQDYIKKWFTALDGKNSERVASFLYKVIKEHVVHCKSLN